MKTNGLIAILVLSLGLLGAYIYSLDWIQEEVIVGLNDEARKDPLLAANLYLKSQDKKLTTLASQKDFIDHTRVKLIDESTLIINEISMLEYPNVDDYLLDWVRSGGHLVYEVSGTRVADEIDDNALLREAGIQIVELEDFEPYQRLSIQNEPQANLTISLKSYDMSLAMFSRFRIRGCEGDAFSDEEYEDALICDFPYQGGYITFIANLDLIRNNGLIHLDHGQFLNWLTATNERVFYLPSLYSPSWFERIWQRSWLIVMTFLLVLLLIIWRGLVRFGSIEGLIGQGDSLFNNHLQAMSRFLIKHDQGETLHKALVADIDGKLEARMPGFGQLPNERKVKILSEITGESEQSIEQLLTITVPQDDVGRVRYTKEFKSLKEKL
ncbi:hypothetical protein FE810_02765 [Thalassotalea litorea]|uniref:DUF4350 domain-containing protein n=1 Tax=Thalassotalea litorea TaxID=2020715 RepID=A0A5R9IV41_9GAMM|nr:hypothetical protein [Thalassotalea litorea]TLU67221.1 hypothetical protein FE810_02765 [Thalassotalea litorea]